jgi:hypothetical protein
MEFEKILDRKINYYGKTEAAYHCAAEEYARRKVIEELEDFAENRLSKDILSEKLISAFELRIKELNK